VGPRGGGNFIPGGVGLLRGETAVLAALEEQRITFEAIHAFDFANENGVVTGRMLTYNVAGKMCERIMEQGNAGWRPVEADAQTRLCFRSLLALGKVLGEGFLPFAEDADAKTALGFKKGKKPRVLIYADENEKRVERDRSEGVGGHAVNLAGFALNSDDGDAGRERTGYAPKHRRAGRGNGHQDFISR